MLVVPFKAEFKLPDIFLQDSCSIKKKDTGAIKCQRKLKESSGNNLNDILAKEPGTVRRSSCSESAFRNCHGKEKNRLL